MTMQEQILRTDELIGRETEIEAMRRLSDIVVKTRACHVLYFQAHGGLGKTRLLQEYPKQVDTQALNMLVVDIIDMYDFENRKPIQIERKIVNSLKQAIAGRAVPIHTIDPDKIFKEYEQAYDFYRTVRGFSHTATRAAEQNIHTQFVKSCEQLSKKFSLVLRFDTFEAILNTNLPRYAFVFDQELYPAERETSEQEISYSDNAGVNIVLKWFNEIAFRLPSTLIIMAGRPSTRFALKDVLRFDMEVHSPSIIELPRDIAQYLRQYKLTITEEDDRISYIARITNGFPLLLTLYAITQPDKGTNPPGSTYEFEDNLIERTFNLLDQLPPERDSNETTRQRHSLIFCLFILSCARRGIRRKELRGVFDFLEIKRDDEVINNLGDGALVKTVERWQPEDTDDGDNTLLLLHDEVLILIDQSEKLHKLSYREPILEYLCTTSEKQARNRDSAVQPLKPMADHMYYELTRDVVRGYRAYVIYADWLLRQRYVQDALILADVFWITLLYEVKRGGKVERPVADQLIESLELSSAEIEREEAVRYVKRLLHSDKYPEAAAAAEALYADFVSQQILPPDQDWLALDQCSQANYYIFADLCITWANAMARGSGMDQAQELFTKLRYWLVSSDFHARLAAEQPVRLNRRLTALRREFFLGETYNMRGQLQKRQQLYSRAVSDLKNAIEAFSSYQETKPRVDDAGLPISASMFLNDDVTIDIAQVNNQETIFLEDHAGLPISASMFLNDDVTIDIAQVNNNLAHSYAKNGELGKAKDTSATVINKYIGDRPIVSLYQQALFHNTNALIHMDVCEYEQVDGALCKAEQAAKRSGVDRAEGLVLWATGNYKRTCWNNGAKLEDIGGPEEIDKTYFALADGKLHNETNTLGELYYDRARFERDLGMSYHESDNTRAKDCWNRAAKHLANAAKVLEQNDTLGILRANIRETGACLAILQGHPRTANRLLKEADELLKEGAGLPSYAQVIAGKIALQRALILLHEGKTQLALREMVIALARVYLFAPDTANYRDHVAFEKLIRGWVADEHIAAAELTAFIQGLFTGSITIELKSLPYLLPPADDWLNAWERALGFFQSLQRPA
jgi:hypothetical protein